MQPKSITLRGVRVHNLQGIDVEILLQRLTVVTGVSGAGKSSLVFDTLYAEAQRRYLQSFSTYTRQFLERFDKPDADTISELPPAIAIRGGSVRSPRATVGSLSEIGDDLRLLFARAGTIVCPGCGQPVTAQGPEEVRAALQAMPAGTRVSVAFSAAIPEGTSQGDWLAELLEEGFIRIHVGAATYRLDQAALPVLMPNDEVWVVLDRVEIGGVPADRLTESIEQGFRRGEGRLGVITDAGVRVFDRRYYCARCRRLFPAPDPRLFDANDPLGACPACQGTGTSASAAGKRAVNQESSPVCPACQGRRLNPDALAVRLDGISFADWGEQALQDRLAFVTSWTFPEDPARPIGVLLEQIRQRWQALVSLGLGYLTLNLSAEVLCDGEVKRIALASALASNLVHVLYLIEQPAAGLHPRDMSRLVAALLELRDRGNTVVVIGHDRALIAAADHVIDLGPGAGEEGGQVVYQGAPAGLATAGAAPLRSKPRQPTGWLKLGGASANNLHHLNVNFPLGVLCAVTGPGGAGKSSLIEQTLYPALCHARKQSAPVTTGVTVVGAQQVADVVLLDQQPLPRRARSNPAIYLKIFDEIRALFAATVDAKIRNFGPGHFSFNQPGGRCETCAGEGTLTTDMQFLADVVTICPECHGRRYRKEILDIKVRSLSIAEVLDLTIRAAFRFFRAQSKIEKKLQWLLEVGLDWVRLGQSLETFSPGEIQRLKLAGQLSSNRKAGTLFLLVQPAAGLHPAEVADLLGCFDRLLGAGHSLIAIEHDLEVIQNADYIIDLGPGGGSEGGRVVAAGTPDAVAQVAESPTGRFLDTRPQ
jgi:excinuclease ABC subunit A